MVTIRRVSCQYLMPSYINNGRMKGDKVNITDILALAKQGYKPNDIKELISIELPTEKEEVTEVKETKEVKDVKDEPNYKEMYETLKRETDKLKEQLTETREQLTRETQPEMSETDTKNLFDTLRSFM